MRLRKFSLIRSSLLFSVPILFVFVLAVWQMQTTIPAFTLRDTAPARLCQRGHPPAERAPGGDLSFLLAIRPGFDEAK